MSYQHPKLTAFTDKLEDLFREADDFLEDEWGNVFPRHPNRPARGATCNPKMDGLFEVSPNFTPGFGSVHGRGYFIHLRIATLQHVPPEQFDYLLTVTAGFIAQKLSEYFPERDLKVVRDGLSYKIIGDFSLGNV